MRKYAIPVLSLAIFLFLAQNTNAQQRFRAGILAGLNASQIQNDDVGGYNRLGLQGGLRAVAVLKEKMDLNIEMLYSQRGSYNKAGSPKCWDGGDLHIRLKYVEVPVVITFKDWLDEERDFYKIQLSGGFSYGRLISASADGSCHDDVTDDFNKDDVSFTIGVEYFASPDLSFGMRWSRSINRLYHSQKSGNEELNSLRGYFLTFRAVYLF